MIKHVVDNAAIAPGLPTDAALAAMSDTEFDALLDTWVDSAQAEVYIGGV